MVTRPRARARSWAAVGDGGDIDAGAITNIAMIALAIFAVITPGIILFHGGFTSISVIIGASIRLATSAVGPGGMIGTPFILRRSSARKPMNPVITFARRQTVRVSGRGLRMNNARISASTVSPAARIGQTEPVNMPV